MWTPLDFYLCYIDSMEQQGNSEGRQVIQTGRPRCFPRHGRGAVPGVVCPPAALHGLTTRRAAVLEGERERRPPPARVLPGDKFNAGQGKPGIFAHKTKKFWACYVTQSKNARKIYPPLKGGITERAGAGQNAKRAQTEKTKPAGLHRRGGKGGRLMWRSKRKQPRKRRRQKSQRRKSRRS